MCAMFSDMRTFSRNSDSNRSSAAGSGSLSSSCRGQPRDRDPLFQESLTEQSLLRAFELGNLVPNYLLSRQHIVHFAGIGLDLCPNPLLVLVRILAMMASRAITR